jgi:16S rRNA (guanine(966)-N(2))-methyltransferase RsmD
VRIIAGKYRGRRLKSPPSSETRPTSDRLRETLFNVLAPYIEGARFLDLCAGTGAVGAEALSRGASHVTFVEQSRKMCSLIEANLAPLQIEGDRFQVVTAEAFDFLRRYAKRGGPLFDVLFYDPPYAGDYEVVLNFVGAHANRILDHRAIVIVERHKKNVLAESFELLTRYRELKQGDSVLSFYQVR